MAAASAERTGWLSAGLLIGGEVHLTQDIAGLVPSTGVSTVAVGGEDRPVEQAEPLLIQVLAVLVAEAHHAPQPSQVDTAQ